MISTSSSTTVQYKYEWLYKLYRTLALLLALTSFVIVGISTVFRSQ